MKINLTQNENKIFDTLRKVCNYIEEKGKEKPTLRIAGGWVRDKVIFLFFFFFFFFIIFFFFFFFFNLL